MHDRVLNRPDSVHHAASRAAIDAALARDDVAAAAGFAQDALAAGLVDPLYYNLAAWAAEEVGHFEQAHALLGQALQLAPDDPLIHTATGRVARKQGRFSIAVRAFDAAIARDPGCIAAWLERGSVLEAGGSLRLAEESFRRAAALAPDAVDALSGIAAIAARQSEWPVARDFAARALALDPDNIGAIWALARADIEAGAADVAARALGARLARGGLAPELHMLALTALGDAQTRLGAAQAAYDAYAAAKSRFAQHHAWHFGGDITAAPQSATIARLHASVGQHRAARWAPPKLPPAKAAAKTHVFLLGYPRSGTTLVETILASAPGVEALEERPTMIEADQAFMMPEDGIARLLALDTVGLMHYRNAYWAKVASAGVNAPGRTFVDMDPLKGLRLPLMARLFPEARIIRMVRDPRDVVWSCFRANFALSSAAYEYTSLERAARHYAALTALTESCIAQLPLNVHALRYEDLVRDFDATVKALCKFTGIAWTPDMRSFNRTAAKRDVATASVGQVRKPLYDGSGQWRRFADQMAPVLPILAPWVEKFGYAI